MNIKEERIRTDKKITMQQQKHNKKNLKNLDKHGYKNNNCVNVIKNKKK